MFFNVLFGIVYTLACLAALMGVMGFFSLLVLDEAHWVIRVGVWLASLAALAALVGYAISSGWMNSRGCSRKHPCYQITYQQPQPLPTVHVKLDLPGTPTSEECSSAVQARQRSGELSSQATVVAECS